MSQATSIRNRTASQADKGADESLRPTRMQAREQAEEENPPAAQPSSHVSPAMRIYRHALESVFALLDLADLSRILAVSREWFAAVRSMKPIDAVLERVHNPRRAGSALPPVQSIATSPLLRHLVAIHISGISASWTPLDNASLGLLAQHASNLTSLWCALMLTPGAPLILPAKLQSLQLQLDDRYNSAGKYTDAAVNGVLTTLAALPSLSHLHLQLSSLGHESAVDLSRLTACPTLTDITFATSYPQFFTDAQVEQIRSSLGHLHRFSVGWMEPAMLARLLQPPVTARWRDIGQFYAGARTGELLLRLPTLTKLDLTYNEEISDVEFLPQLPHLTSLCLDCDNGDEWSIPADALLASLVRCSCLTDLNLSCGFKSAHWSALFAKLPIKTLTVYGGALDSLRCFAAGPITQSLQELTLKGLTLLPSELPHLYGLRRLRTLDLDRCFSPCLSDATIDSLKPPTPLLPTLTVLSCHQWLPDGQLGHAHRTGASYEWMQRRRTQ